MLTWVGYVNFEGRTTRVLYLYVGLDAAHDFPADLRVTAPELDEPFEHHFDFMLPTPAA
jgi:hypothetical protein